MANAADLRTRLISLRDAWIALGTDVRAGVQGLRASAPTDLERQAIDVLVAVVTYQIGVTVNNVNDLHRVVDLVESRTRGQGTNETARESADLRSVDENKPEP